MNVMRTFKIYQKKNTLLWKTFSPSYASDNKSDIHLSKCKHRGDQPTIYEYEQWNEALLEVMRELNKDWKSFIYFIFFSFFAGRRYFFTTDQMPRLKSQWYNINHKKSFSKKKNGIKTTFENLHIFIHRWLSCLCIYYVSCTFPYIS